MERDLEARLPGEYEAVPGCAGHVVVEGPPPGIVVVQRYHIGTFLQAVRLNRAG